MNQKCLCLLVLLVLFVNGQAQVRFPWQKKIKKEAKFVPPQPTSAPSPKNYRGLKPFSEVITQREAAQKGLLSVYKQKGKYFVEIPDSVLGRDVLIVSRISQAAAGNRAAKAPIGYAGDKINQRMIRFEVRGNKLDIRELSYLERAEDSLGMYQSLKNSSVLPIIASLEIQAFREDKHPVVDMTNLIEGDNTLFFFHPDYKRVLSVGGFQKDRSYVDTVTVFPMNVEIKTVKTYSSTGNARSEAFTYGLNTSIVLLPKEPMKGRLRDDRVGYFSVGFTDFDLNPQGIKKLAYITRWRLEPKDEDVEKYNRGELVEPKKPIVFYIDPATPKKWIPYLKAGVDDWQKAFEQAGFKNAIYAKEVEEQDSTWSIEDARHSAIVYKPSTTPNASGPHVADPRSGEIIESHINWYHNVMLLLRNWYFVQASPIDERARKLQFEDELMGQLIRFVSSHEVGHTLGLRHNFGSSATIPVEKLRDKSWVEANGHTPSIMDYARFNYVAQPEDNISEKGIFPRIGMYDKWAIEWGYRWYPQYDTPQQEAEHLSKVVTERLAQDIRYRFGHERDIDDPRSQNEDLGDNSMKAGEYGIRNLKRIIPNLLQWTYSPQSDYSDTREMYAQVVNQYARYMGHVAKNVGGIYSTPTRVEDNTSSVEFTPASIQKEAVAFLNKQLFNTPTWLIDKSLYTKAGVNSFAEISKVQIRILARLQNFTTINKLAQFEAQAGDKAYSPMDLYADLQKGIWSGLTHAKGIDIYRRALQKAYIANLREELDFAGKKGGVSSQESSAVARAQLVRLKALIQGAIPSTKGASRYHLQDCLAQISEVLDTK